MLVCGDQKVCGGLVSFNMSFSSISYGNNYVQRVGGEGQSWKKFEMFLGSRCGPHFPPNMAIINEIAEI